MTGGAIRGLGCGLEVWIPAFAGMTEWGWRE